MKKDREFNDILNKCLERILGNNENIEQCLENYPEQRSKLEPLLRMALSVRKASAVMPSANFKAKTRYQFHLALAQLKSKRNFWNCEWRLRLLMVASLILVILFAGGGMGIAIYHSMPGQFFHPARLAAEEIWLVRSPLGIDRVEKHAILANRRVAEIIHLVKNGYNSAKLKQVTQQLYYHLATIESLATAETVVMISPVIIDGKKGYVFFAAEKFAKWTQFKTTLEQQVANHLTELNVLLPLVPESIKPALLSAIAVTEAGYERAIEGLKSNLKLINP